MSQLKKRNHKSKLTTKVKNVNNTKKITQTDAQCTAERWLAYTKKIYKKCQKTINLTLSSSGSCSRPPNKVSPFNPFQDPVRKFRQTV